jgi:hypothetical protein
MKDDGPSPSAALVTTIPYVVPGLWPPSSTKFSQLPKWRTKPPLAGEVLRITTGPEPEGSFRTMIGLAVEPLMFVIFSGPRGPDTRVMTSPGSNEDASNVVVVDDTKCSAADALRVPTKNRKEMNNAELCRDLALNTGNLPPRTQFGARRQA